MAKLYSSRIEPLDEWILVRVASTTSVILRPVMKDGKTVGSTTKTLAENKGQVVAVGPGARGDGGARIPVDDRIKPGVTVVFPGKVAFRPPDIEEEMAEEGLYFLPASTCICILKPEGMPAAKTIVA